MIKNKFILFIIINTFLLSSCKLISFTGDDVTCTPESSVQWYDGENVLFEFSCSPVHYFAEESISIKSSYAQEEAIFEWTGNTVAVKPKNSWVKGRTYNVIIDGTMYTEEGSSFSVYEKRVFNYGKKDEVFLLTSFPNDIKNIDSTQSLVFTFNKPVSKSKFIDSFSISPSLDFTIEVTNENKTFTVTPKTCWNINNTYKWSIKDIASTDGWEIQNDCNGVFSTKYATNLPELKTTCPVSSCNEDALWFTESALDGNIGDFDSIGFIFSKDMDSESVKKSFEITPSICGYLKSFSSDKTKFIFVPEESYKIDCKYTVSFSTEAKDEEGLNILNETKVFFTSTESLIEINKIILDSDILEPAFPQEVEHTFSKNTNNVYEISIQVFLSKSIDIKEQDSFLDMCSLNLLFPLSSVNPTLTAVSWNEDKSTATLTWNNFTINSKDNPSYYKFKVLKGNFFKEELCIVIQAK